MKNTEKTNEGISIGDSIGVKSKMKSFLPGNHKAKIHEIKFKKEEYAKIRPEYMLHLILESEPIGDDFIGFDKVFGSPQSGKFLGLSSRVRAARYNYYDGKTPNGFDVSIAKNAMMFLRDVFTEAGAIEYWNKHHKSFNTVEEFVDKINIDQPLKDCYINWCLGGKEYKNKNNYTNYDLFIVKGEGLFKPFSANINNVMRFFKDNHIIKWKDPKVTEVPMKAIVESRIPKESNHKPEGNDLPFTID